MLTAKCWFNCVVVAAFVVLFSAVPCARAANLTWQGNASADWFNITNWVPNAGIGGPFPADQLTLDTGNPDAGFTTVTTDLGGSITLNSFDLFSSATFENLVVGSVSTGTVTVNGADFSANTVSVNGAGSSLNVLDTFNFFVVNLMASNSSSLLVDLVVTDAPALVVENATFNSGASMTVNSGNTVMLTLSLQGTGAVYQGVGGGVETASLTLSNGASVTVSGSHSLNVTGTTTIGAGANPVTITTASATNFRTGTLVLNGGQLDTPNGLSVSTLSGFGTVSGAIAGDNFAKITATGSLILGDATSFLGFNHDGSLDAGINTVTLNAAGFANLGVLTTLSGGAIQAANGVALGVGDNVSGSGQINAKVAAALGSTIRATGNLAVGDASAFDGFTSDGVLIVNNHTVTLHDANEAVLGSLTTLGDGVGSPGTLVAANGLVLEFGKNITGFGTIDTPLPNPNIPNDPIKPLINNGFIGGNSVTEPITLNGFVKGVGSFANILINGTLSPGFSPAEIDIAGDAAMSSVGVLEMELGGTSPGSGHDKINVAGTFIAGGTLDVMLINGFVPGYGDTFDLFDFGALSGSFDQVLTPNLGGGLFFDTSLLLNTGTIAVVPAPGSAEFLLLAAIGILIRRRVS